MNLLKSPLRRTTAALAGAFIGLAGAVAFAAPAMATHPTVTGTADCVSDKGWKVTWTVTNEWPNVGELKSVDVKLPEGGTLTGDIVVGATLEAKGGKALVGEQLVPADAPKAKLRVGVLFDNDHRGGGEDVVDRPTKPCEPETPPTTPTTPPTTPEIGEAEVVLDMDCDTMTFGLDNPEDGEEIKIVLTTSKGEKRELTIKPGEKKTEKFSATEGFVLTVKDVASGESVELPYKQPENCAGSGSGGGDELAETGAPIGTVAGGAAALLAVGGGLFFLARRRKVKFTA